jgi:type II secretory pathway component PulF
MLHDIAYRIQSGMSISSSMARYENVLGTIAVNLIKIGEETGSLDRVFKDISEHYARIEDFVSKVKQALIYPAFALFTISSALIFWLVYVLPRLAELFKDLNVQLPTITVAVLNVSEFVKNYLHFIIITLTALVILFFVGRRKNERFRYITDKLALKIPIISMILYNFNYAFFSEYMRLMINAGVSLFDTLSILEEAFNNRVFKKAMSLMKERISGGGSISGSMRETGIFPSLMVRMIAVGEEAGGLDQQLDYLAKYYYNKLDYITQNIAKIIEPVIIITVGLFMAIIMISLMLPIYDLISQIGGRF